MNITSIYQVYLRFSSGISQAYVRHFSGISQDYLRHTPCIYNAYLEDIISWPYFSHMTMTGIYQAYQNNFITCENLNSTKCWNDQSQTWESSWKFGLHMAVWTNKEFHSITFAIMISNLFKLRFMHRVYLACILVGKQSSLFVGRNTA